MKRADPPPREPTSTNTARRKLVAHAMLVGDRINTAGLEQAGAISVLPLAFHIDDGIAAVFRYGAVVFVDVEPARQVETVARVAERVSGRDQETEEEIVTVLVRPGQDDLITTGGVIELREATTDHLLILADVLAKSVALARDERRVAAVFDAIEPFASTLAASGRPPGARRRRILRLIGEALQVQHRVSGRVAVREKPDILWDRSDLERLYGRLADEYELVERAETLDRKLAAIAASTAVLIGLQDTERSLRLEAIIVLLILAELALASFELAGEFLA